MARRTTRLLPAVADAALVRVTERERIRRVFTVDRADFSVYRLSGGRRLTLLP